MNLNLLENKLAARLEKNIEGVTPGIMIQVYFKGKKTCDISVGKTYPYYDLASLTKIIFTVQAFMHSYEQKKWNLQSKVTDFLPDFPHQNITIVQLLSHHSGLPWWHNFYKELTPEEPHSHLPQLFHIAYQEKWDLLKKMIYELPLVHSENSVYSDVGFILLGLVLEKIFEQKLEKIWIQTKELFYPNATFESHLKNEPKFDVQLYAPTEKCSWRGFVLQGQVHDENAWSLEGLSSHAGIFGSIDDLGWYILLLRSQLLGFSKSAIKQKTAQLFTQRARPFGKGDWSLGYMMTTMGTSSSGSYFSPYSIGHTGFTGPSVWYDPTQDLGIAILTNRVYYGRDNQQYKKLRPEIHNWIVEGLRRGQL